MPPAEVPLVARELPPQYIERMLRFLAAELGASRHLHAVLLWAHQIMLSHAARLRDAPSLYEVPLRALHKGARLRYDELGRLCNSNLFTLDFLIDQLQLTEAAAAAAAAAAPPLRTRCRRRSDAEGDQMQKEPWQSEGTLTSAVCL